MEEHEVPEWWDSYVGRKYRRNAAFAIGFTPFESDSLSRTDWKDVAPEQQARITHALTAAQRWVP